MKKFILLFLFFSQSINSQEEHYLPASIREDVANALRAATFPTLNKGDELVLRFAAKITKTGHAKHQIVYRWGEPEISEDFEKAVYRQLGLSDFRLNPARVNDRLVSVWFNFTLVLEGHESGSKADIHPSLLHMKDRYGENYIGPQKHDYMGYPNRCRLRAGQIINRNANASRVWFAVDIDEKGLPSNFRIISGEHSTNCGELLEKLALEGKYIPAQYNGQFIKATYFQPLAVPRRSIDMRADW